MPKILLLVLALLASLPLPAIALDDGRALAGLSEAPVIYDLRTDKPDALAFMLGVIADTRQSMQVQGVKGETVVSMRGPTVKMLVEDNRVGTPVQRETLASRLKNLANQGVRLEACGYALSLFALDPEDLLPGVTAVGNSLISLIGYQNRGYALVAMN